MKSKEPEKEVEELRFTSVVMLHNESMSLIAVSTEGYLYILQPEYESNSIFGARRIRVNRR